MLIAVNFILKVCPYSYYEISRLFERSLRVRIASLHQGSTRSERHNEQRWRQGSVSKYSPVERYYFLAR